MGGTGHIRYIIFYIFSRLQRPALKVYIRLCKTGIYSWNLSENVYFLHEDSFLHFIHFFAMWSISAFMLSVIAWKAPASSWSPSKLVMLFKNYPRCFGPFGKFQNTVEISSRRPLFSDYLFVFNAYGFIYTRAFITTLKSPSFFQIWMTFNLKQH